MPPVVATATESKDVAAKTTLQQETYVCSLA